LRLPTVFNINVNSTACPKMVSTQGKIIFNKKLLNKSIKGKNSDSVTTLELEKLIQTRRRVSHILYLQCRCLALQQNGFDYVSRVTHEKSCFIKGYIIVIPLNNNITKMKDCIKATELNIRQMAAQDH
jgi:hypothetical protein